MNDLNQVKEFLTNAVPDPSDDEIAALRRRVMTETTGQPEPSRRSRGRLPRGRVLIPVAAAAITGTLALSIGLVQLGPDDTPPADTPPAEAPPAEPAGASQILGDAAAALEADAPAVTIPRADQWRYKKTAILSQAVGELERQDWMRADYGRTAISGPDGELITSDGEGTSMNELHYMTGFSSMVDLHEFFADLPDDPAATLDRIFALIDENDIEAMGVTCGEGNEAYCAEVRNEPWYRENTAFWLTSELLRIGVPPAEVQAKLLRALGEIRGVEDVGPITDFTGKNTLAVAWRPPFQNRQDISLPGISYLLIDPETSMYRGTQSYFSTDPEPTDEPTDAEIILDSGFVDQPGQRP